MAKVTNGHDIKFNADMIEQIGNNIITAIADPDAGKIAIIDEYYYKVTKSDFDKIADNISNAIGDDYIVALGCRSYRGLSDITVFDDDNVGIVWWNFFIIDGVEQMTPPVKGQQYELNDAVITIIAVRGNSVKFAIQYYDWDELITDEYTTDLKHFYKILEAGEIENN